MATAASIAVAFGTVRSLPSAMAVARALAICSSLPCEAAATPLRATVNSLPALTSSTPFMANSNAPRVRPSLPTVSIAPSAPVRILDMPPGSAGGFIAASRSCDRIRPASADASRAVLPLPSVISAL